MSSERKRTQPLSEVRAAQEADHAFRYFIESVTEYALLTVDPSGFVATWSAGAYRTFGYAAADIVGMPFETLFAPEEVARAQPAAELAIALRDGRIERDCWHLRADGSRFWATNTVQPLRNDRRELIGYSNIVRDSTERYLANAALRESDERFRLLVEGVADYAILFLSSSGELTTWNSGAEKIFGYPSADIVGRHVSRLFLASTPQGDLASGERWFVREDGTSFFATTRLTELEPDTAGNTRGFVLIVHDITHRKYEEEALRRKAFYDKLTGLPNRALFLEKCAAARERLSDKHGFAVLFLDLDNFKTLNDKYGHATADLLLKRVADGLERSVRPDDFVARLSGDEFAILLEPIDAPQAAVDVAERARSAISKEYHIGGAHIHVAASVGVACGARDDSPEQTLRHADFAMYEAKRRGRGQHALFDDAMSAPSRAHRLVEGQLREAIERGQLFVEYQPIVALATSHVVGFEALVRWPHPSRGSMAAAEFIPMAEQSGLIVGIDRWVFEEASKQLRSWQLMSQHADMTMSVNFSTLGLAQPGTIPAVRETLQRYPITPGSMRIEITESVLMETSEQVLATLTELRQLGLELHLDDFGTGYSSLSYLRRCGASALKIDQSFVSDIANNVASAELVRAIVSLAHTLRLRTVAEGVETERDMKMLRDANCDFGQGYFFSAPISADEATALIEAAAGDLRSDVIPRLA